VIAPVIERIRKLLSAPESAPARPDDLQIAVAVLLVEQHARAALGIADRAYVMDLGRIVYGGSARALLDDEALAARWLGRAAA